MSETTNIDTQAGNSTPVASSQTGPHERLQEIVERHMASEFRRPIPEHAVACFDRIVAWLGESGNEQKIVIDAGCGTGESALNLARLQPDSQVVAVDRSSSRLRRRPPDAPTNVIFEQMNVEDLVALCARADVSVDKIWLLFPNPSPKSVHVKRRWHAHPCFPAMVGLTRHIELRTNWGVYAQEFADALRVMGFFSAVEQYHPDHPLSRFEAKYAASGHTLYRVISDTGGTS